VRVGRAELCGRMLSQGQTRHETMEGIGATQGRIPFGAIRQGISTAAVGGMKSSPVPITPRSRNHRPASVPSPGFLGSKWLPLTWSSEPVCWMVTIERASSE